MIFKLVLIFNLLFSSYAWSQCDESEASKNLFKAGRVTLKISGKKCSKENKNCIEFYQTDRDYCLNKKIIIKFSCKKDESIKTQFTCPIDTICVKDACLKK